VKIFIDTSMFIRHYYGVDTALKLLEFAVNRNEAVTSQNVIEETFFKLLYLETERLFGKTGKSIVKEKFRSHPKKYHKVKAYMTEFLIGGITAGSITLLENNERIIHEFVEIAYQYSLLPNDALIAATCKYHSIQKIITFDANFKDVKYLDIIDLEQI
jgi:predicted nucleic acid-binding protein